MANRQLTLLTLQHTARCRLTQVVQVAEPGAVDLDQVTALLVDVPASRLGEVAELVRQARRRRRLGGLLVAQDQSLDAVERQLKRLDLRRLPDRLVYRSDRRDVPERVLQAWDLGAQEHLIADAERVGERLLVRACDFRTLEVPFDAVPALARLSPEEQGEFTLAPDGAYLHWPGPDLHLDLEALEVAIDPAAAEQTRRERVAHDARLGAAVATVRQRHGLSQADMEGVSERQVRRIEQGASPLVIGA